MGVLHPECSADSQDPGGVIPHVESMLRKTDALLSCRYPSRGDCINKTDYAYEVARRYIRLRLSMTMTHDEMELAQDFLDARKELLSREMESLEKKTAKGLRRRAGECKDEIDDIILLSRMITSVQEDVNPWRWR